MINKFREVVLDAAGDKTEVVATNSSGTIHIVAIDHIIEYHLEDAADLVMAITRAMAVAGGDK